MYDVIPVLISDEENNDSATRITPFPAASEFRADDAVQAFPSGDSVQELSADSEKTYGENSADDVMEIMDLDALFSGMDAFREQARQLQLAIARRQEQAEDLKREVKTREEEARALAETIAERQARADSLVGNVEAQVDRVLRSLEDNMSESLEEMRSGAGLSAEMKEQLAQMQQDLTAVSDKVHTEGVQSYRNLKDVIAEHDHHEEEASTAQSQFSTLKRRIGLLTFLGVANLAALAAVLVWIVRYFM